jgi:hypothetical protein
MDMLIHDGASWWRWWQYQCNEPSASKLKTDNFAESVHFIRQLDKVFEQNAMHIKDQISIQDITIIVKSIFAHMAPGDIILIRVKF